jgi:hypothetical protein
LEQLWGFLTQMERFLERGCIQPTDETRHQRLQPLADHASLGGVKDLENAYYSYSTPQFRKLWGKFGMIWNQVNYGK